MYVIPVHALTTGTDTKRQAGTTTTGAATTGAAATGATATGATTTRARTKTAAFAVPSVPAASAEQTRRQKNRDLFIVISRLGWSRLGTPVCPCLLDDKNWPFGEK